eukprot:366213-Chlamydomonas_euryale.AAC.4
MLFLSLWGMYPSPPAPAPSVAGGFCMARTAVLQVPVLQPPSAPQLLRPSRAGQRHAWQGGSWYTMRPDARCTAGLSPASPHQIGSIGVTKRGCDQARDGCGTLRGRSWAACGQCGYSRTSAAVAQARQRRLRK